MADTQTPTSQSGSNEKLRSEANQAGSNQTLRQEQAKGEVSGGSERGEKGAIGGADTSRTGEPGRARNELGSDQDKSQFDKSRSEPTGQR